MEVNICCVIATNGTSVKENLVHGKSWIKPFIGSSLKDIIGRYIRLGLITSIDNVDAIAELSLTPVLSQV